jgi:perosamine synthetase
MSIPLFKIYWDNEDIRMVTDVISSGSYWTTGPNVQKFEDQIARYVGTDHCITFNSGTSALHALMEAYGIKKGDEVIVPSFTFIATANTPLFTGAKPVFADIEEKTLGLDPDSVLEKITEKTRAIIPIHYAGCPCLIAELKEIADNHGLILIEDAAESFGATIGNDHVGTFGDSAMFSFCQNKVITTGEGGCIVTNSNDLYEKLKLIRSHGREESSDYFATMGYMEYIRRGYNFRMSDITAACGIAQIGKVGQIIDMRRKNAEYLTRQLSEVDKVILPCPPAEYNHVYQMYTIRVKSGENTRNDLMKYLAEKGISTKVYFYPVHLTAFYKKEFGYRGGELPVTEKVSSEVLTLPMYPELSRGDMDFVAKSIRDFFENR